MAASKQQKEQAARMLAAGHSEAETADTVKVGRSTIQNWKRKSAFVELINNARLTLNTSLAKEETGDTVSMRMVLEGLQALKVDESAVGRRLWALFDKLEAKTAALIESTEVEDFGPRQLPAMIRANLELAQIGFVINDRVQGIEGLVSAIKRVR